MIIYENDVEKGGIPLNYQVPNYYVQPQTGKCIAAIVLGAISLLLCGNVVFGIAAIVLGAIGYNNGTAARNAMLYNQSVIANQQAALCNKYGKLGLILGIIGIALMVLLIILWTALIINNIPYLPEFPGFSDFFDQYYNAIR